jgi:hypothetical protein
VRAAAYTSPAYAVRDRYAVRFLFEVNRAELEQLPLQTQLQPQTLRPGRDLRWREIPRLGKWRAYACRRCRRIHPTFKLQPLLDEPQHPFPVAWVVPQALKPIIEELI